MVRNYWAIVEGDDTTGYSVFFPDLPGCVSAGDTIEQTLTRAAEAAAFHLEGMVEDGEALPEPCPLADLPRDKKIREAAVSLVTVSVPGKAVRVQVTIDEGLLQEIDRAASAAGSNRSAFLAQAARDAIMTNLPTQEDSGAHRGLSEEAVRFVYPKRKMLFRKKP
ncbi:MAG: type II toxin-antitoxin system HicB family antitoxin [Rhodospirillales bacterium]